MAPTHKQNENNAAGQERRAWQTPTLVDLNNVQDMTNKRESRQEISRFSGPFTSPGGGTSS